MRNKRKDIPYLGVNPTKIKRFGIKNINKASLNVFLHQISERYKIHLKKDVMRLDPPFTKDKILKQYRFTNVRREQDKESKWLISNVCNNNELSYSDKLLNCILFRLYNKHETAELIKMPIKFSKFNLEKYNKYFIKARKEDPKRIFFTSVFFTSAIKKHMQIYLPENITENKNEMGILYFIEYLIKTNFTDYIEYCNSAEEVITRLRKYKGIGKFFAYQIFVDFTYILEFPFSENEYVQAGPGAQLGLNYLFNSFDDLTHEELIFWLRDNWDDLNKYNKSNGYNAEAAPEKLFKDLPVYDRKMNVMSIQNCLCEFSKYYKAYHKIGRPRQKYIYRKDTID